MTRTRTLFLVPFNLLRFLVQIPFASIYFGGDVHGFSSLRFGSTIVCMCNIGASKLIVMGLILFCWGVSSINLNSHQLQLSSIHIATVVMFPVFCKNMASSKLGSYLQD